MQKKISFLPALHPRDEGFKFETGLAIGDVYINYRERLKLCVPDRAFLKEDPLKSWKLGNRNATYFKQEVRQELDDYDIDYRKYMSTWERGIDNPRKTDKVYLNSLSFTDEKVSPPKETKTTKNINLEPISGTKSTFKTIDQSPSPTSLKS